MVTGLFDLQTRLERIDRNDTLTKLDEVIDWDLI